MEEVFAIDLPPLKKEFVQALIKKACGDGVVMDSTEGAYVFRGAIKGDRDVGRVILLPPQGFTAPAQPLLVGRPEVEHATIDVKGAIREGKQSFSKTKNCLKVISKSLFSRKERVALGTRRERPARPTQEINDNELLQGDLTKVFHSAGGAPFSLVKSSGLGFFNNMQNTGGDWLVLQETIRLRPERDVDLEPFLQGLEPAHRELIQAVYDATIEHGPDFFDKAPEEADALTVAPSEISIPALGEMLFAYDSGRDEPCQPFGIILRIAMREPEYVMNYLERAKASGSVPLHFVDELQGKILRSNAWKRHFGDGSLAPSASNDMQITNY